MIERKGKLYLKEVDIQKKEYALKLCSQTFYTFVQNFVPMKQTPLDFCYVILLASTFCPLPETLL